MTARVNPNQKRRRRRLNLNNNTNSDTNNNSPNDECKNDGENIGLDKMGAKVGKSIDLLDSTTQLDAKSNDSGCYSQVDPSNSSVLCLLETHLNEATRTLKPQKLQRNSVRIYLFIYR